MKIRMRCWRGGRVVVRWMDLPRDRHTDFLFKVMNGGSPLGRQRIVLHDRDGSKIEYERVDESGDYEAETEIDRRTFGHESAAANDRHRREYTATHGIPM